MEHYYQFIDRLAEWFMMLFFDPAYHYSNDNVTDTAKLRKRIKLVKSLKATKQVINRIANAGKNKWFHRFLKTISLVLSELLNGIDEQIQVFQLALKHLSVQLIH